MEKLLIGQLSILGLLYMAELQTTKPVIGNILIGLVVATWIGLAIQLQWSKRK